LSFVIGSFLGVIGGFATEWAISWYRNRMNREKLKENIRDELNRCIERLIGKGKLLPTSMWHSIVATGDLKLLPFSQRTKLSVIYFGIDNFNYEAKRVRDSEVLANVGTSRVIVNGMTPAKAYWNRLSEKLLKEEDNVKQKLSKFLKEPWL